MIAASDIDAVLVTTGTRPLQQVLESLQRFRKTIVWDNTHANLKIFGRYVAAATLSTSRVVYVQDDDCLVPPDSQDAIIANWGWERISLNFPEGNRVNYAGVHGNIALVGFGAVFDKRLATDAFNKYFSNFRMDELFLRECDRVFTALTPWQSVDVPKENRPWAGDRFSMESESRHLGDLEMIKYRIKKIEENAR